LFDPARWHRQAFESTPIYLHPERPDWFVPTTAGDRVLRELADHGRGIEALSPEARRFLGRLPDTEPVAYPGRGSRLSLDRLEELWLHLTDRCNLECSHCLFCSSPTASVELETRRALDLAAQARALGCRVFALTGGEPLVHPGFAAIVDGLLADPEAHVVCLSNGLLLERNGADLLRWPAERFHLQISLDGIGETHDQLRGAGAFERLLVQLRWLREQERSFTLSLGVRAQNRNEMAQVVDLAHREGATNLHFMWYFVAGRGAEADFADPMQLFAPLREAEERAKALGLVIDNLDSLRSQIFAPSGTIHDGSGAGWDSLAVGPDGNLYPSAALVGREDLCTPMSGDPMSGDLARAWRESPVLEGLRQRTVARDKSPWRLILGGGDLDHAYARTGGFDGADPYLPLHEALARWLIAQEAGEQPDGEAPGLRLKMGEVLEVCGAHGDVALVHSNCLLGVASGGEDSRAPIKAFYGQAAEAPNEDVLNPARFPEELVAHVPDEARVRSYGCGSPVTDAGLEPGEAVMDLGCGAGLECFVASALVGASGSVIGLDMLERMVDLAERGGTQVAQRLGYRNTDFRLGYIEALPLADASVDVVLSNCVLNLCTHKRRAWREIFRVLRPGGRLVVADVVCETEPPAAIRNDETLRGECIGGALTERDLMGLLEETGFCALRVLKRFPYRVVADHPFFSLTFEARRPSTETVEQVRVQYRGPFGAVMTGDGQVLRPGSIASLSPDEVAAAGDQIFVLDDAGSVTNVELEGACCSVSDLEPSESDCGCDFGVDGTVGGTAKALLAPVTPLGGGGRLGVGCMTCGAELVYLQHDEQRPCTYCGRTFRANAFCTEGHFVCDGCHTAEGRLAMELILLASQERDLVALLAKVRRHPSIPMHGPEHHALVPGVILTALRNHGIVVTDDMIRTALDRAAAVPGGYCGFLGACGAALGAGAALAAFESSSPLTAAPRQRAMALVAGLGAALARYEAARCCQRDSWIVLREVAKRSEALFGARLTADAPLRCDQVKQNKECIRRECPLFPTKSSAL
jgi:MoaA/NifB/PqqE/SkfB family radical SAM enzyme/SAM-dependent methyltransferase